MATAKKTSSPAAKRARLLQSAIKLVYQQGFDKTTLADIAADAKVPLGNVYYYFKTKKAIGKALIGQLIQNCRTMRQEWDKNGNPQVRLDSYIETMFHNREQLARSGCPIGTLCTELQKAGGPLAQQGSILFAEFLAWIETQFQALGQGAQSRDLAVHLLAALEGAILLAHSFRNPEYILSETSRLRSWVRNLTS